MTIHKNVKIAVIGVGAMGAGHIKCLTANHAAVVEAMMYSFS